MRRGHLLSPVRPATHQIEWQLNAPSRAMVENLPRRIVRTPGAAVQPTDAAGDLCMLEALDDSRCASPGLQFAALSPGVSLP